VGAAPDPSSGDVERLFRRLVANIAALDPSRLARPFPAAEIAKSLVPYRTHRVQLALETSEDYEMAVLRLLAGEGGFAIVEPAEAADALAAEARSVNPETGLFRRFANAMVTLDPERVAAALEEAPAARGADPEPATAPPPAQAPQPAPAHEAAAAAEAGESQLPFTLDEDEAEEAAPAMQPRAVGAGAGCPYCGGDLPVGRAVLFCPHCGQNVGVVHCPTCGSELDVGWQFCITCGQKVTGGLG